MIYIVIPTTSERRKRLDELITSIRENTDIPHCIVIYENNDGGWVSALHHALEGIDGYVMILGDDTKVCKGWLSTLWKAYKEKYPNDEGVVEPFNEIRHGSICQHPFGHSKTIKKYLDKDFIHNFSDKYMTIQLNKFNGYTYVPEAKIEHLHWTIKKAPKDDTYRANMATHQRDKLVYYKKTGRK